MLIKAPGDAATFSRIDYYFFLLLFFTSSFLLLLFMHSVFISTWQSDSPALILGSVAGLAEGGGIVVGGASLLR